MHGDCLVLCIRGEEFELGAEPTEAAVAHLEEAFKKVQYLIEHPDPAAWQAATNSLASIH